MYKKKIFINFIVIFTIFFIAFFARIESTNLNGIQDEKKSFYIMDEEGHPYMYELDSYYNYRLTKNYIEFGHLGDSFINGTEWDSFSYSPPGVPMDYPPLLIYLTAFIYKIINFFGSVSLLTVCFWLPMLFSPLAGLAAFIFVKRFTNDIAGIITGILIVLVPFYLLRTIPGWFDTDMFNLLFPILIVWFFMEAIHSKTFQKRIFYTLLSSISIFLFSMAWNGWQYLFYIISIFTLIYILVRYFKQKTYKDCLLIYLGFAVSSLLLILIFTGFINFIKPFYGLLEFFNLIAVNNVWSPWPDLYIAVSELGRPTIMEVVSGLGLVFMAVGIFGIFLIFRIFLNKKMKKLYLKRISWFFYLFLLIWIILGFLSLFKGARFIILVIPPLAISAGVAIGILVDYMNNILQNNKFKNISYILFIIILILPQFLTAHDSLERRAPLANDDLWSSAKWIRDNTSNDTLIISDWSYGHFYSAIAERPVSFDGRSAYIETLPIRKFYNNSLTFYGKIPNTSREYWISRAFSTSDEKLSASIFRMLATSGDTAYLILDNFTGNTSKSVMILNDILGLDKNSAALVLRNRYNFTEKNSLEILKYTHPDEVRPFVVVTYDRMIKTGKWDFYFGNWDFNNVKGINYTYSVGTFNTSNEIVNSTNNVVFDPKSSKITWNNSDPYCLVEIVNNTIKKRIIDQKSNFCIWLLWDDNTALVIDKKFENSIFTKLVLEKRNTEYMKIIYKNKKVVVWKTTSY
ncbi:MAG: STT3 domain-containing protein [Methanobacteriaceae archaeon]|nr:STT3 domain-containing protein [Methanobacteriaceae archaeon]